jgi:predicted hydrolase (HD superfamily)
MGSEILRAKGYPEEIIACILSHADYLSDRYPRRTVMEKGLYACDEITGLVTATAILRPSGIGDLTASSVMKKMKSKGFAKGVNRDDVIRGAADFGVELGEHIQFVIEAMKTIAPELGLDKVSGDAIEPAE